MRSFSLTVVLLALAACEPAGEENCEDFVVDPAFGYNAGDQGAQHVRLIGRYDTSDPDGPRFAWSGSAVQVRFCASSVAVRLRGSSDFFRVILDGADLPVLAASPSRELYPLAEGLDAGPHQLDLVKRTEPLGSETQLLGFELDEQGRPLPPPPAAGRRIEFIGDSVTAGFGVLGADATCSFSPETEDFTLSYAALTAAALEAEPIAVAWSGRGVVRNYNDEPGDTMPVLYERTLPARADSRWDFSRWIADVVVIDLGTNDFSVDKSPPEQDFVDAYAALLRRVRAVYPQAPIFSALGPMLTGALLREWRRMIGLAIDQVRAEGTTQLELLEFVPQSSLDGYGCDHHPSATTHRRMAEQLTAAIRSSTGW